MRLKNINLLYFFLLPLAGCSYSSFQNNCFLSSVCSPPANQNGSHTSSVTATPTAAPIVVVATPTPIPPPPTSLIMTIAGPSGYVNGNGTAAQFTNPTGLVYDSHGNLFISDSGNSIIRKMDTSGNVTLFAGIPGQSGTTDGAGTVAQFNNPAGLVVDSADNIFVADTSNNTIRKITPAGTVTTVAGTAGVAGISNGTGLAAQFNYPIGLTFDSHGNLFIADDANGSIREMTPQGVVTTFAGRTGTQGEIDGTANSTARFSTPFALAFDSNGNLFVLDGFASTVREIDTSGNVTTVAGQGNTSAGYQDGTGTATLFNGPSAIAIDPSNNLFIADQRNDVIREITPAAVVTTFVGTYHVPGGTDGTGASALFNNPYGIIFDSSGNLIVSDSDANNIRKITPAAVTSTIAGAALGADTNGLLFFVPGQAPDGTGLAGGMVMDANGNTYVSRYDVIQKIDSSGNLTTFAGDAIDWPRNSMGSADGTGTAATFADPQGLAIDGNGTIYVADATNGTIREITPAGVVTTLAGSPPSGSYNSGFSSANDVDGTGTGAAFNGPVGIAVDAAGTIYVSEPNNEVIRKVTQTGVVTTFAGTATNYGYVDATGAAAEFGSPNGMVTDMSGNLYVCDTQNYAIRMITPAGVVSTFAGNGSDGILDGTGTAAGFDSPMGITIDSAGNLFVTETIGAIRKITPAGVVTTIAGNPAYEYESIDGDNTIEQVGTPDWLSVDSAGNLIFSDDNEHSVRKFTSLVVPAIIAPAPTLSAFATPTPIPTPAAYLAVSTLAGYASYVDGPSATARFNQPTSFAFDSSGNMFIADAGNNVIRKMDTSGNVTLFAGTPGQAGNADGARGTASFTEPYAMVSDGNGNLFVTDLGNNLIRKVSSTGVVSTFAGNGTALSADGNGTSASFNSPAGIAIDSGGNLYVADLNGNVIREIDTMANVTTIAGDGNYNDADGAGTAAELYAPTGLAFDSSGNLYITTATPAVRMMDTSFNVTTTGYAPTVMGTTIQGIALDSSGNIYVADNSENTVDEFSAGPTNATFMGVAGTAGVTDGGLGTALFYSPYGITFDSSSNLWIADTLNHEIREIIAGVSTTVAGFSPTINATVDIDGTGTQAGFQGIMGVAVDSAGNTYATSTANTIRMITPAGVTSTLAGTADVGGYNDATGSAAQFQNPIGIVVDSHGNIFVADSGNFVIREITSGGVVTTFAGQVGQSGQADGTGISAMFTSPGTMAIDASDDLYVSDGALIRMITPAGVVTTFAGTNGEFNSPPLGGMVVDTTGNLYVCNPGNNQVNKVAPDGTVTVILNLIYDYFQPLGITIDSYGFLYIADGGAGSSATKGAIRRVSTSGAGIITLVGPSLSNHINYASSPGSPINGIDYYDPAAVDSTVALSIIKPTAITINSSGTLIFSDQFNSSVRMLSH
jgi:sugar lactone lactonase YvrE